MQQGITQRDTSGALSARIKAHRFGLGSFRV